MFIICFIIKKTTMYLISKFEAVAQ